ncbi:MAG: glycosyltransferase family 2 protein [Candidatus Aenigmarchaeota archaeon]|nr:glycosyltransferase family 2 protein [Candidatus Aenigmarchaeota archaeon]
MSSISTSVVISSYKRAWALRYSLESLVRQIIPPDEVVIVLKPSRDGSEDVIKEFSKELPIKLIIQKGGFVAEAEEIGIRSSSGKIIVFLDDDAIAEERLLVKYIELFEKHKDAGGIGGIILKAQLMSGKLKKYDEPYFPSKPQHQINIHQYCRPLSIFNGYYGWISKSGFSIFCNISYKKGKPA